ncbi:MAG: hypothetical protein MMC33_002350 [Icmadophila ericetorum]|nr:hypothetical protein [Icmadophila ericetorum]
MSDNRKSDRVVFVGNIPYGLSEEQIVHIFGTVGQVLNFRLVHDQETGKPKGYGFVEFADVDSAHSAVRNLDKYQIMGRELRVDYSEKDKKGGAGGGNKDNENAPQDYRPADFNMTGQPQQNGYAMQPQQSNPIPNASSNGLPQLPPGVDVPPGLTCPDAISKTLSTLPPPQLLDILTQMKSLVMNDPARATELLKSAPQLSYAIFQALLLMGLVDTTVLSSVVEQVQQPPPQQVPPPQQHPIAPPTHMQQPHQQPQGLPPRPPMGMPQYGQPQIPTPQPPHAQQFPPHAQHSHQQNPNPYAGYPPPQHHTATPPVYNAAPYAPPQQQQAPPPPQAGMAAGADPEALLKQVLAMPQAEVDRLPPNERGQIMALKQQFGGMAGVGGAY